MKTKKQSSFKRIVLGAASAFALVASLSSAPAEQATTLFDIQEDTLQKALIAYSEQSDRMVVAPAALVAGKAANPVRGQMSSEQALAALLRDSGLQYTERSDGTITITEVAGEQEVRRDDPFRMAQLDQENDVRGVGRRDDFDDEGSVDVIVVTGTNIRGIAPESSPTLSFDRDEIEASGAATAQDFIRTLPQNFSGGSNSGIQGLPNDVNAGFNSPANGGTLGSSVNLRGLGSGSTLVLLNGHRLAPSSGIGDFVDISLIPASAIERVEVLTDGASSIYGADAVAGVVNFILRKDFEGLEASYRYGSVTEGGHNEHRASITGGTNWGSGHGLITYEYLFQDNLSAADRSFSSDASFPNDLLPSQERHSVLAAFSQELGSSLEIYGDLTFAQREVEQSFTNTSGTFLRLPSSQSLNLAAGGSWAIPGDWALDFGGTYSEASSETDLIGPVPNSREIDSELWTADLVASGDLFEVPAGNIKIAIGGQFRTESFRNFDVIDDEVDREADRDVYAAFGELFVPIVGEANRVPGVERFEINISGRFEDFSDFGSSTNPKVGLLWAPIEDLKLRGSYSTSFNPPPLGRIGASDLTGQVLDTDFLNTVLGLTPGDPSIADVVSIFVIGTNKDLEPEQSTAFTVGVDYEKSFQDSSLSLSATWFDINFEDRLGDTPIPDGRLTFDAPNIAFNNPELFPAGTVIFSPSQSTITQLIDSLDTFSNPFSLNPLDTEIINNAAVVRNLSSTNVRGLDFNIDYSRDLEVGVLSLGVSGTYLKDFEQQDSPSSPVIETLNTQFNPVDLVIRGRIGYSAGGFAGNIFVNYTDAYRVDNVPGSEIIDSWTTIDLNLAYTFGNGTNIPALKNSTLRLSALNLFDQDPPETPGSPSFGIFGYDATNASPLNRFIAIELTKRF